MVDFCVDLTEPNVPNGVYTLESVSYTQKEDGPFGIDFFWGWTYNNIIIYMERMCRAASILKSGRKVI